MLKLFYKCNWHKYGQRKKILVNSLRYLDFKNRKYKFWNCTLRKLELS